MEKYLRNTVFCIQLPTLHRNVVCVVYLTISISCSSGKLYACFALRHCDDAGCDGLATCTSTLTHRIQHGVIKKRYIVEELFCRGLFPKVDLIKKLKVKKHSTINKKQHYSDEHE